MTVEVISSDIVVDLFRHFVLAQIIKTGCGFHDWIARAVHNRQKLDLPLLFYFIRFDPLLDLAFIAPVTDESLSSSDLMKLSPSSLSVLGKGHKVFNGTGDLSFQNVFTKEWLCSQWSADADTLAGIILYSSNHPAGRAEATSDIQYCLLEQWSDHLGELDEVGLSRFGRFFLVLECSAFESTSG